LRSLIEAAHHRVTLNAQPAGQQRRSLMPGAT
jgi:hypothetical protein